MSLTESDEPKPQRKSRIGLNPETLISSIALVLLVNVFQRSVGFGRAVLFCRWLEPEELGYWEMAFGFLLLAAPLAVLGLPGSFSRYLEKYRQQGRLWQFLRRTVTWTLFFAASSILLLLWFRESVAQLVFGEANEELVGLTVGLILSVGFVAYHHFVQALFGGLRLFRVVSALHLMQSLLFAAISLVLLHWWKTSAESVLVGYAAACFLSTTVVLVWASTRIEREADSGNHVAARKFWTPLLRFAAWLWVTNLLSNLFTVIDRYMILHNGTFETAEAMVQVGNYHSSNIVPVLLISVAGLIVGAMTPHLSHEWETGHRESVSTRLGTGLKLTAIAMLFGGILVLLFCPVLFHYAFENKYDGGLAVLPWTLAACVWFSLLLVAETYVLVAEKTHLATVPLVVGLVVNVILNLILLPMWGLLGAVVATALATLVALLCQLTINFRLGMKVSWQTVLLMIVPLLLGFGPEFALAGLVVLVFLVLFGRAIFTQNEREEIKAEALRRAPWLARWFGPRSQMTSP